ncbi:RNA pseudouridine synthase [Rhodospirillaceae bacterium KN72]|uniref:RNA pseudouridine synthase n=1 Tax=Pacificispira spongiicola TaxID=2729598 RepID=A0A7Y0HF78_9PROT|nr:RNA pseudouridine synthase [Pacificispira spongiicola]NMM45606.1 RNA pseudouridine synthase [Pacificispira spongiicola]
MTKSRQTSDAVAVPDILYRDGLILVVNKPAGVPVHAGPSGGASLEDTFDALRFGLPKPPSLAHRLDRDTSGCLVLGRHAKALRRLGKLFQEGRAKKTYWAIVRGLPPAERGRIDFPLKKVSTKAGGWRMIVAPDGQESITDYMVMGTGENGLSWLALWPKTGRTHQIRVHCAQSGFPLYGDPWYGTAEDRLPDSEVPLHLHARAIELPIYPHKEPVRVEAPLPDFMREAFDLCSARPDAVQVD